MNDAMPVKFVVTLYGRDAKDTKLLGQVIQLTCAFRESTCKCMAGYSVVRRVKTTFAVVLAVTAPPPRWQQKPWKGLLLQLYRKLAIFQACEVIWRCVTHAQGVCLARSDMAMVYYGKTALYTCTMQSQWQ